MFSTLPTQFQNSPQSLNVILATGSAFFWVTTGKCTTCAQNTPRFNDAASSTFQFVKDSAGQQVPYTITYTTATSAKGYIVRDTMAMGGFQTPNYSWFLVDDTTYPLQGSNAGIMGLAFDSGNALGLTPFWQTLADGNKLPAPEMSFWLTRRLGGSNTQDEFGGIFTLGGQNQTLYTGKVEFRPLVTILDQRTNWLLNVSSM